MLALPSNPMWQMMCHFMLSKVVWGLEVPTPTRVNKSQHGGEVPTFEPQEFTWGFGNLNNFMQNIYWELGLAFCSTQLTTQILSLASKNLCHVGIHVILRTWDLVWSGKFQSQYLLGACMNCHIGPCNDRLETMSPPNLFYKVESSLTFCRP